MQVENQVQSFVPKIYSAEKIYEMFLSLGYPEDKILDPTYKRKKNLTLQERIFLVSKRFFGVLT